MCTVFFDIGLCNVRSLELFTCSSRIVVKPLKDAITLQIIVTKHDEENRRQLVLSPCLYFFHKVIVLMNNNYLIKIVCNFSAVIR